MANARMKYFSVSIRILPNDVPLPFEVYLKDTPAPRLFIRRGEAVTRERLLKLFHLEVKNRQVFLVPEMHRQNFERTIWYVHADPEHNTKVKAHFVRHTMLQQVGELFVRNDLENIVDGAKLLVDDLVNLVIKDPAAVRSLMRLSQHDYYTYSHSVNVAIYSIALARSVAGDNKEYLVNAGLGGLLHDVGKRKIGEEVINKRGKLSPEEWVEIKKHPDYGADYVRSLPSMPEAVATVVGEHHENCDGSGYPKGLEGSKISEFTRIVSVADVFDALTTNRSYQKAVSPDDAMRIMMSLQPGKFDSGIMNMFRKKYGSKKLSIEMADFDPCDP